jgi:hypothetical protein
MWGCVAEWIGVSNGEGPRVCWGERGTDILHTTCLRRRPDGWFQRFLSPVEPWWSEGPRMRAKYSAERQSLWFSIGGRWQPDRSMPGTDTAPPRSRSRPRAVGTKQRRRLGCSQNACSRRVLLFPVHNLSPELLAAIRLPQRYKVPRRSQP